MIVVAGLWELGWNTPIKEVELWKFMVKEFNVDSFAMTPISGIRDKSVKEFDTIDDIINHYNLPVVIVDERAETNLAEFVHPKDVIYLFGRANYSPLSNYFKNCMSVKIETIGDSGRLWPHQAASIILYDRLKKS